jgi:hypothetical protein
MSISVVYHVETAAIVQCEQLISTGKPYLTLRIGEVSIIPVGSGVERMQEIRDCIDACLNKMATPPVRDAASVPSFPAREGCAS